MRKISPIECRPSGILLSGGDGFDLFFPLPSTAFICSGPRGPAKQSKLFVKVKIFAGRHPKEMRQLQREIFQEIYTIVSQLFSIFSATFGIVIFSSPLTSLVYLVADYTTSCSDNNSIQTKSRPFYFYVLVSN